jgi:Ca2+-binding EF-hand superfamily protein
MTARMRWFAAIPLLLGACGTHQPTAECVRFDGGMRAAFVRYDTNNDDRISPQEYRAVINKLVHSATGFHRDDPGQTNQDFADLDVNHDGYLTFDEFTGNVCKDGH